MEIFKIVGLGITATILSVIIKQYKPEYGIHISIATGVIIFFADCWKVSINFKSNGTVNK